MHNLYLIILIKYYIFFFKRKYIITKQSEFIINNLLRTILINRAKTFYTYLEMRYTKKKGSNKNANIKNIVWFVPKLRTPSTCDKRWCIRFIRPISNV